MRGKETMLRFIQIEHRITPAYAGKRAYFAIEVLSVRDHPRLCGEKFQKNRRSPCYKGSPPPMRGKVYENGKKVAAGGITPAYAGKR